MKLEICMIWIVSLIFGPPVSGQCQDALGMESGDISDGQLKAFADASNVMKSRLNNPHGAWSPNVTNGGAIQWVKVDLNESVRVTALATQGWSDGAGHEGYVTLFKMAYGNESSSLQTYKENGLEKVFPGNTDAQGVTMHNLSIPIYARYVGIFIKQCQNQCYFRFELYGCTDLSSTTSTVQSPLLPTANTLNPLSTTVAFVTRTKRSPAGSIAAAICGVVFAVVIFGIIVCFWKKRKTGIIRVRNSCADTNTLTSHEARMHNKSFADRLALNLYASIKERNSSEEQNDGEKHTKEVMEEDEKYTKHETVVNDGIKYPEEEESGEMVVIYAHSPYGGRRFNSMKNAQDGNIGQNPGATANIYNEIENEDIGTPQNEITKTLPMKSNNLLHVPTTAPAVPLRDPARRRVSPKIINTTEITDPRAISSGSNVKVQVTDINASRSTDEGAHAVLSKVRSFSDECIEIASKLLNLDNTNQKADKVVDADSALKCEENQQENEKLSVSEIGHANGDTSKKDEDQKSLHEGESCGTEGKRMQSGILETGDIGLSSNEETAHIFARDNSLYSKEYY